MLHNAVRGEGDSLVILFFYQMFRVVNFGLSFRPDDYEIIKGLIDTHILYSSNMVLKVMSFITMTPI